MTTKEINDLISLIANTAFSIGNNIIIDKGTIEYHLDLIKNEDIRKHIRDVIYSLLSAQGL